MSKNKKIEENPNKKKKIFFNTIIIICIIAIVFSSYNIILWFIDNQKNKNLLSTLQNQVTIHEEQVTIDERNIKKRSYDFQKLKLQNPDTIGWIYVPNTNVDYPVVQTTDNDYYLNHSFDKSENSAGWVFADYRSTYSPLSYNTVIYGHNRKDQSMFGSLQTVLQTDWYSNEDNLYINFSTINESHIYKVFSTFVCNDKDVSDFTQTQFSGDIEFNSYIKNLMQHSSYNFDTDIDNTKQIITLYTCYGLNNQRLLVCASLID